MSETEQPNKPEADKAADSTANQTDSAQQQAGGNTADDTVSPWPTFGEATDMAKKLFQDTSQSIREIYQDYKDKRKQD